MKVKCHAASSQNYRIIIIIIIVMRQPTA